MGRTTPKQFTILRLKHLFKGCRLTAVHSVEQNTTFRIMLLITANFVVHVLDVWASDIKTVIPDINVRWLVIILTVSWIVNILNIYFLQWGQMRILLFSVTIYCKAIIVTKDRAVLKIFLKKSLEVLSRPLGVSSADPPMPKATFHLFLLFCKFSKRPVLKHIVQFAAALHILLCRTYQNSSAITIHAVKFSEIQCCVI